MTFRNLGIIDPILKALSAEGYTHPTPIQEKAIPIVLSGKDLLGCAQTGTGKTAAFAIPILQHLYTERQQSVGQRKIRALIVTPTRELAIQISDSLSNYGRYTGVNNAVIFGGVKQGKQTQALRQGVDVLVATPGRLLDLMNQGYISLKDVGYLVLDEADRMLDMGFINDIKKIIAKLPLKRQSLFFSATMPPDIVKLSAKILGNPEKVSVMPEVTTAEKVDQSVVFAGMKEKTGLLVYLLKKNPSSSTLVFTRTKSGADKITRILKKSGIDANAIHGNKSQGARQKALEALRAGRTNVLVATDIAARGIDIDELQLVINYNLPNIPETYVHRIGRTGRAGAGGKAISFCDAEERSYLRDIEKLIMQKIPVDLENKISKSDEKEASGRLQHQTQKGKSANRAYRPSGASKKSIKQKTSTGSNQEISFLERKKERKIIRLKRNFS